MNSTVQHIATCYHCGETKNEDTMLHYNDKLFCCNGCSMVYQLLQKNNLCDYYTYNNEPGTNMSGVLQTTAFAALDEPMLAAPFIHFSNQEQTDISFYLPQMHCSSCIWLLDNLHKLNLAIFSSTVDFSCKQVYIQFNHKKITARQIAELLASVGYTPDLHTNIVDDQSKRKQYERRDILELGIAGFCFSNIMMLSFPEYLGLESFVQGGLSPLLFRTINLCLALPVFFYSGRSFFKNAWLGVVNKKLNIDMPIALAMVVTFMRSLVEITTGVGGGYLDSLSGIILFMLIGRYLQRKIAPSAQFNRRVDNYFPVAVATLQASGAEQYVKVDALQVGDIVRIHAGEIIPVDADLLRGKAIIDYAFVTGESMQYQVEEGAVLYAGGKQCAGAIDIRVLKPFSLAGFSRLWNTSKRRSGMEDENKFVEFISNYFSVMVLALSLGTLIVRSLLQLSDPWGACTAVLIVACPCGLLLTSSFTYGFITNMFARKGFYLRNGAVLAHIAETTNIVFDKTGTLTAVQSSEVLYIGEEMSDTNLAVFAGMLRSSLHPLSKRILQSITVQPVSLEYVKEHPGAGVEAWYNDTLYKIGAASFIGVLHQEASAQTTIYVSIEGKCIGKYEVVQQLRAGIQPMLEILPYPLTILSGDNAFAEVLLKKLVQRNIDTHFNQQPSDKFRFIQQMQESGSKVMMIGDGLNDAGALAESNTAIAVVENTLQFSPASDAIIHASTLPFLAQYIQAAKHAQRLIVLVFLISLAYNIVGLFFAVTAQLVPMIAAILMPISTLTIVLCTLLGSTIIFNRFLQQIPSI